MKPKKGESSLAKKDSAGLILAVIDTLRFISLQFTRFCQANHIATHEFKEPLEVYNRWLAYDSESFETDAFAGEPRPVVRMEDLWKVKDSTTFWKAVNPYSRLSLAWPLHFSGKARRKFASMNSENRHIAISKILEIAAGNIVVNSNCKVYKTGPCQGMVAFTTQLKSDFILLWTTQVFRLPIVRRGQVQQFDFLQYLIVIEFVKKDTAAAIALKQYHNEEQSDPDKWILPKSLGQECQWQEPPSFENSINIIYGRARPVTFPPEFPKHEEAQFILFNKGRWRSTLSPEMIDKPATHLVETYLTQMNANTLAQLADAESCKGFIRLLETIPNFRIKLTEQERELIGTPGNVLAIGRSGTGKTTCALLRLFASEVLFKFRSQREKGQGSKLVNTRFEAEDVENSCGLHIVFATASPVLTNEVKRFYWRLNDHIKEELKRRHSLHQQYSSPEEYNILDDPEGDLEFRRQSSEERDEIKLRTDVEQAHDDDMLPDEDIDDAQLSDTKHSMSFLQDTDFPLFTTIRRLVLMVDATQRKPFFARNVDGAIIGMSAGSEWHNEMKGVLVINQEYKRMRNDQTGDNPLSSDSSDDSSEEEIQQEKTTKTTMNGKKFSFEVDYEYFEKHFYAKIAQKAVCSAIVLWTEIVAYIKGSAEAHKHPGWYLPKHIYTNLGRKTTFLHIDMKSTVWDHFIEYERWRINLGAYDFQDLVNYQLYFLELHGYQGVPIHYMMIDEVQDLTHSTLLLIAKITEQSLFFSGDTAQTIAKGVGFRFCDLKSLFYQLEMEQPEVRQLTVNFRSHGKILALANSVVSLLEAMFPRTIDKLAKEESTIDGPKPMILNSQSVDELFFLLFGVKNVQSTAPSQLARAPIEFGCDQVIIVRSQDEKDQLPCVLKGALCLTVYESKGLEFDDVVLYNFFAHTNVPETQWRILQQIVTTGDEKPTAPSDFDAMESSPTAVKVDNPNFDDSKYSLLCTELKMLYVAITRPRKRLILFDCDHSLRRFLLEFWRKLDVVDELQVVSSGDTVDIVNTTSGQEVVDSIASATTAQAWRTQGIRMLKHRFYDQAVKCFEYSHDEELMRKAKSYSLANEAAAIFTKSQQTMEMMKMGNEHVKPSDRKAQRDAKEEAKIKFVRAGEEFEELGMNKQAAKCYFSAKMNLKAAKLFAACESWGQCAEAFSASSRWTEAGKMFEKAGEYLRAIDNYKLSRKWDLILDCIHNFSGAMSDNEKENLIKKYIPLALEELMPKVVQIGEDDQVYSRKLEVEAQSEGLTIAEEEQEEEEEEERNEEEETQQEGTLIEHFEETKETTCGNTAEQATLPAEDTQSIISIDSSVLNISSSIDSSALLISAIPAVAQPTNPFAASTNPFADLTADPSSDSASSYTVISEKDVPDTASRLEVLSKYDPDDEWLQIETGSIAESLHSAVHKDGSVSFDYSIFDNSQAVALNLGGQLIKTRADVFVEDGVMRKILQYISMFSGDVRKYLEGLRSADRLVLKEGVGVDWKVASIIDLDEVDVQLITTVLDTLEYFQLYKLCLVVCNRYSLSDRLGRYVTSLAHKYSSLPDFSALTSDKTLLLQKEKAVVSYAAVHNVLEMIHPGVLAPKPPASPNSLGVSCFQSLLLLGYWKKGVYLLDTPNALAITATFSDFKNYRNILNLDSSKGETGDSVGCFRWVPPGASPDMMITAIDEATWELNQIYPTMLRVGHKREIVEDFPIFPEFAEFNGSFWRFVHKRSPDTTIAMKQHLVVASLFVTKCVHQTSFQSPSICARIHDCFSFLTLTIISSKLLPPVKELLLSMSCEHFEMLLLAINACEGLLALRKNPPGFSSYHLAMVTALLAPLGVQPIRDSEVTRCLPLSTHVIVSRYSIVKSCHSMLAIDMEGEFLLCPLSDIAKIAALEFVRLAGDLSQSRYRHWATCHESNSCQFDTVEELTTVEAEVKTAACIFGELGFVCEMQARYRTEFPNALKGVKPSMAESSEETELESLEQQLRNILAIGDTDRKSMKFVLTTHAVEISDLQKRITVLKLQHAPVDATPFTELFSVVVSEMAWILDSPPVITPTARNYLLTYTQSYIKTIKYITEKDRTQKMISAYRVFSLCQSEILMLDLIRSYSRPILIRSQIGIVKTAAKEARVSTRFLDDLAWLDVQVYFRLGDWLEAGRTLLRYLDCQFPNIDTISRVEIIEKIAVFGLVSHCNQPYLPEYYSQKIWRAVGKIATLQSDANLVLAEVFTWLNTMSPEISEAYAMRGENKRCSYVVKAVISIITAVLINVENPHAKLMMAFETLRNTLARHIGSSADSFLKKILTLTKAKDIANLRNEANRAKSQLIFGNFVYVDCSRRIARIELDRLLDSALYSETKEKSLLAYLDYKLTNLALIKQKKYSKLKVKPPTQVTDYTERTSLTQACGLLSVPGKLVNAKALSVWRNSRAAMRLYQTISKTHISLMEYNQRASGFTNVLDRHHVLHELFSVADTYASFQRQLSISIDSGDTSSLLTFVIQANSAIEDCYKSFIEWMKILATSKKLDMTSKKKKKWDARWKMRLEHKQEDTGRKKQKYLQRKAANLKRAGRS